MDIKEWSHIFDYLSHSSYPPTFDKTEKRRLREKCKSFKINSAVEKVLFHVDKKGDCKRVIMSDEKVSIMHQIHSNVGGGHFGKNATAAKISSLYYWKGVYYY